MLKALSKDSDFLFFNENEELNGDADFLRSFFSLCFNNRLIFGDNIF